MEFFEKAFTYIADLSCKLPATNFKSLFFFVICAMLLTWVIVALTLCGSRAYKLIASTKKIRKYLANVDVVDDDNVSDFTARCFSKKAPQPLRDAWMQYLGVRYGYPSEIVSDCAVYDKVVKKHKDVRSGVYVFIGLLLIAAFLFWGCAYLTSVEIGVIMLLGLGVLAITYLLLVILYRNQLRRCLDAFENMQEDLDVKVNLQVESNYATDSSPLMELNALVEEIIARNTAKVIDIDETPGPTPIEELIEQTAVEQTPVAEPIVVQNAPADEICEATIEEEPVEETVQETIEEEIVETPLETPIETIVQEVSEESAVQEELVEEDVVEDVELEEFEDEGIDTQATIVEQTEEIVEETMQEETVDESEQVEEIEEPAEEIAQEPIDEIAQEPIQEIVEDEVVEESADVEEAIEGAEIQPEQPEEESIETAEKEIVEDSVETVETIEGQQAQEDSEDSQDDIVESEQEIAQEDIQEDVQDDVEEVAQEEEQAQKTPSEKKIRHSVVYDSAAGVGGVLSADYSMSAIDDDEYEEIEDDEEYQESVEEEPEVVYVVDGDDDEDVDVKPAKLVKLPNLVDYMLSKNMPKAMKIQIATMLMSTYKKFEHSPEDRKIVVQCLGKVMADLQK